MTASGTGAARGAPDGAARRTPPWIFGITCIPYGVAASFSMITMPKLLRDVGLDVGDIGWLSAVALLPAVFQFLFAPIIDLGLRRRTWLLISAALGAACLGGALLLPLPARTGTFAALVFAAQLFTGLIGTCNGALMSATLTDDQRGRAGGFYNAGNLGGGSISAGLTLTLLPIASRPTIACAVAAMTILPALAVLAIPEPPRPRREARAAFATMWREVSGTLRAPAGWTGILTCASPVGTAALTNLFSALAADYHASERMVAFVDGYAAGVVTAAGSLAGGLLCERMNRRRAYLLSGALSAACAVGMMAAGLTPTVFAVGVSVYMFVAGICYAAFSAMVLETVGAAGSMAATRYTLFTSAGNLAIAYTTPIDSHLHAGHGARGVLGVDAVLNLAGIAILAVVFRRFRAPPPTRNDAAGA